MTLFSPLQTAQLASQISALQPAGAAHSTVSTNLTMMTLTQSTLPGKGIHSDAGHRFMRQCKSLPSDSAKPRVAKACEGLLTHIDGHRLADEGYHMQPIFVASWLSLPKA